MEIQCKNCRYEYDFKLYGERCPQCGFENTPFRSQAARRMMGYQKDSIRDSFMSNYRAERREELLRSGDPDYGRSPLRRIRKYVFMVVLCLGVLLLGQNLLRLSNRSATLSDPKEKPALSSLSSASFNAVFQPVQGIKLQVKHTGTVPDSSLGQNWQGKVQCVFVDVWATADDERPGEFPGKLFIRLGDQSYPACTPSWDGADLRNYTAFSMAELFRDQYTGGQFFFYVPLGTDAFTLCWQADNTEQRMELHL